MRLQSVLKKVRLMAVVLFSRRRAKIFYEFVALASDSLATPSLMRSRRQDAHDSWLKVHADVGAPSRAAICRRGDRRNLVLCETVKRHGVHVPYGTDSIASHGSARTKFPSRLRLRRRPGCIVKTHQLRRIGTVTEKWREKVYGHPKQSALTCRHSRRKRPPRFRPASTRLDSVSLRSAIIESTQNRGKDSQAMISCEA